MTVYLGGGGKRRWCARIRLALLGNSKDMDDRVDKHDRVAAIDGDWGKKRERGRRKGWGGGEETC